MAGFFGDQMSGGEPTASWKPRGLGDGVAGEIIDYRLGQATVYQPDGKGPVKLQADGTPVPKLVITLQSVPDNYASATRALTDENGQIIPDDGRRSLHVEKNTNISFAIAQACHEAGTDDVAVGGKLWVKYVEDGAGQKGSFRKHEAGYQPPAPTSGFPFAEQQQQQPVQQQPQIQQQAPQPQYTPPQIPQQAPQVQQFQQPVQQQAPQPVDPWSGAPIPAAQPQQVPQVQGQFAPGNTPATMGLPPETVQQQAPMPQTFPMAGNEPPF